MTNMSLTHKFISEQLETYKVNHRLVSALSKTWKQENHEELLSFVNLTLWTWCVEGTFDEYLSLDGNSYVAFPRLVQYMNQRMQTKIYKDAKDGLVRHRTGARTQTERANGISHPSSLKVPTDTPNIVIEMDFEDFNNNGVGTQQHHIIVEPKEDVDEQLAFRSEFLKGVLSTMRASDRYTRIYDLMCQDMSVNEMAELEGDTIYTMRTVVQTLKSTLTNTIRMTKLVMDTDMDTFQVDTLDLDKDDNKWFNKALSVMADKKLIQYDGSVVTFTDNGKKVRSEGMLF